MYEGTEERFDEEEFPGMVREGKVGDRGGRREGREEAVVWNCGGGKTGVGRSGRL